MWSDPAFCRLMITIPLARRRSDSVIYALWEGHERVWVGGEKISTIHTVSVNTDLRDRNLLWMFLGVS